MSSVEYWRIELARHDILLAEGLPAESYLDTGDPSAFGNSTVALLHPAFGITADSPLAVNACAPLVEGGAVVAATRAHLADRAVLLGCPVSGLLHMRSTWRW